MKFELTDIEKMSPVWKKLEQHFEDQLQHYREMNDHDKPEEGTAKTRGRIAQLKDILRLGEPKR